MTLEQAVEKLNELEKASYAVNHAQSVLYVTGTPWRRRIPGRVAAGPWHIWEN